ncbi:MAG: hypothetical protein EOP48_17160 [Sphingobacteriales bacterium]|nr:MAG: hypothetical protein EOP48_17160 [Sphingobacteriales bacterium]
MFSLIACAVVEYSCNSRISEAKAWKNVQTDEPLTSLLRKVRNIVKVKTRGKYEINKDHVCYLTLKRLIDIRNNLTHKSDPHILVGSGLPEQILNVADENLVHMNKQLVTAIYSAVNMFIDLTWNKLPDEPTDLIQLVKQQD